LTRKKKDAAAETSEPRQQFYVIIRTDQTVKETLICSNQRESFLLKR